MSRTVNTLVAFTIVCALTLHTAVAPATEPPVREKAPPSNAVRVTTEVVGATLLGGVGAVAGGALGIFVGFAQLDYHEQMVNTFAVTFGLPGLVLGASTGVAIGGALTGGRARWNAALSGALFGSLAAVALVVTATQVHYGFQNSDREAEVLLASALVSYALPIGGAVIGYERAHRAATRTVTVAPLLSPESVGAVVGWRF